MGKMHVYGLLTGCILLLAAVFFGFRQGSPALYRVGQLKEDGTVALTEVFSPSGVTVSDMQDREATGRLAAYARQHRLPGKKMTHQKGGGRFQNLEEGVYLLTGAGEEALLLQVTSPAEQPAPDSSGVLPGGKLLPVLAAVAFVFSATGLALCLYLEKCGDDAAAR